MKNFKKELPPFYGEVLHIGANDRKLVLLLCFVGIPLALGTVFLAYLPFWGENFMDLVYGEDSASTLFLFLGLGIYSFLHEVAHGLGYKLMTGEKISLRYGKGGVYCGVPDLYTSRKAALTATLTPFVVFTVLLGVALILLFGLSPQFYMLTSMVAGVHLCTCTKDLYVARILLTHRGKDELLVREVETDLYFYLPKEENRRV